MTENERIRYAILKRASQEESFNTRVVIEEVSKDNGWSAEVVAGVLVELTVEGKIAIPLPG